MITIGIFAYNEESSLARTFHTVVEAAKLANNMPIEIIVVNDGSTDNTGKVISDLQRQYPNIKSISHPINSGIGTAIKDIVNASSCEKICFVPGDDVFTLNTLKIMLLNAYKADIVLHYHINSEVRKKGRNILSVLFTSIYKFTFNLHVIYVNCIGIYPTALLKSLDVKSKRHGIAAELNVKTLLQGYSYHEVASYMKPVVQKSSALNLKTVYDIIISFIKVFYDVKVANRDTYSKQPVRVIDII